MGEILRLAIQVLLMYLQNRFDPKMIKAREIVRIRHAKEKDLGKIEKAISTGNTAAISRIWRGLQPS